MDKKKVLFISDFGQAGSGYMQISTNLALGLANRGYEVRCIGLAYQGEEHYHPFSIYPAANFQEVNYEYYNLTSIWKQDVTICALDIPMQENILRQVKSLSSKPPYIGIFPVEGDPLCMDWALVLSQMQAQFCISQFGTDECRKQGIEAEHLQIGIDTKAWRLPSLEEKQAARSALGIDEGDLVVLTVADNQERKNLSSAMKIVAELERKIERPVRWILVTREFQPTGWKLRTLANELGFKGLMILERGLPHKQLLMTYFAADQFLLTSKAEGLCMPVLEAMATGVPVYATDCTALGELVTSRGSLLPVTYTHRDVFGNSSRYYVDINKAVEFLAYDAEKTGRIVKKYVENARKYVEGRTWDITADQLDKKIKELIDVKA